MQFHHDPARHTRTPRPSPQVEHITRRSGPTPSIDATTKLRQDLTVFIDQARGKEDQRRRACYGLLSAILTHYEHLGFRAGEREEVVNDLREFMERIGAGPEQVLEVNALWAAIPDRLCRHDVDMTKNIMDLFKLAVVPNHRMRERLDREIQSIKRSFRNAPDKEKLDYALAGAFGRLCTKI